MKRTLVLRNDIREIARLAAFIDDLAGEAHLDAALAMSLNLALEEAVTSVVMYAYPPGQPGKLELVAERGEGFLRFVITDAGKPFDPTAVPDVDVTLGVEERPVGGLGVFLMRRIMDEIRYARRGGQNVLILLKKI